MKSSDLLLFLMMQGLIPFQLSELGIKELKSYGKIKEKPIIADVNSNGKITIVIEDWFFPGLDIRHVKISDDAYYVCNKQNNYELDLVNVYDYKTAKELCKNGSKVVSAAKVWEESDVIVNLKKHKFKL